MTIRHDLFILAALSAALIAGCGQPTETASEPAVSYEDELRLALETAEPGAVILVPEGTHALTRSLTLNTDGINAMAATGNVSTDTVDKDKKKGKGSEPAAE